MTKFTHFHLLTPSPFIPSGKIANLLFLISPPTIRGQRVESNIICAERLHYLYNVILSSDSLKLVNCNYRLYQPKQDFELYYRCKIYFLLFIGKSSLC